jgi:hypothetical protein
MKNHRLSNTQLRDLGTRVNVGTKGSVVPQSMPITNQIIESMLRN